MRFLVLTILGLGISVLAMPVQADEFGMRFRGKAPAALADEPVLPQGIEPAAGASEEGKILETRPEEQATQSFSPDHTQQFDFVPHVYDETAPVINP